MHDLPASVRQLFKDLLEAESDPTDVRKKTSSYERIIDRYYDNSEILNWVQHERVD